MDIVCTIHIHACTQFIPTKYRNWVKQLFMSNWLHFITSHVCWRESWETYSHYFVDPCHNAKNEKSSKLAVYLITSHLVSLRVRLSVKPVFIQKNRILYHFLLKVIIKTKQHWSFIFIMQHAVFLSHNLLISIIFLSVNSFQQKREKLNCTFYATNIFWCCYFIILCIYFAILFLLSPKDIFISSLLVWSYYLCPLKMKMMWYKIYI